MCKEYKIARETVEEFINSKDYFSFDDISKEIKNRDGVLAVSTGTSVEEYLKYFVRKNILRYDSWQRVYEKVNKNS